MFQKISAKPKFKNPFSKTPKTPDAPDAPDTPDTKKQKDPNPLAPGAPAAGAAGVASAAFDMANKLKSSSDPVNRFVGRVMDFAKDKGLAADRLQQELGEREVLISQLLQYMPEDLLAKYFDEFLFVRDIPWIMTREFMNKAVKAETTGANARDVLDFALVFYDKRRNFNNTISIIDTALDLQPTMRNINIFQALKESLSGSRNAGISFMLIGKQNIDKAILLNKLMGMVAARGAEDLEVLRRDYQKSKDQVQRKREIADRFRGIYDTMMSMEFQSALKRNIQFITEQFALSVNDPDVQAFARILYDIKLGQEFRKEAFAPLESRSTAETTPSTTGVPQGARTVENSFNYRFVVAQTQQKPNITPVFKAEFKKYIDNLKNVNSTMMYYIAHVKKDDAKANELVDKVRPYIKSSDTTLNAINVNIDNPNANFQELYNQYIEALKNYDVVNVVLNQLGIATTANQENKFLKLAQGNSNPNFIPPGSITNAKGPENSALGGQGKLLTNELASASENIFKAAAGVSVVGGIVLGDLTTALAAGTAIFLHSKNKDAINIAKTAGLEPPKDMTDERTLQTAAEVFKSLGENNNYVKEFLANQEFVDQVNSNISVYEKNLLLILDAQVKTADGSESTPLESPEAVDKAHRDFMAYLRQANQTVSRQLDLVDTMTAIVSKNPDVSIQNKLGSLKSFRLDVFNIIESIRSKISEYGSLTEIIGNIQKQKFLMLKLKEILPQLDKYLAAGLSSADVLAGDGGLLSKVRDYINIERDSYNKLYKQWNDLVAQFPSLRFDNVTSPEAPQTQNSPVVPSVTAPNITPTVSENVQVDQQGNPIGEGGGLRTSNIQFSNLMFEKKIVTAASDPLQQAKYNFYVAKMNVPGMNLQNLVRALDGDMTFTDATLKLLARNAILAKSVPATSTSVTQAYEGSNTNQEGQNIAPSTQQQQQTTTTGVRPSPGSMQLAQDEPGLETQPGQPLPSQAETDLFTKIKSIYAEFEKQFNNYGIMPSLNTVQSDPKRMIASIRKQLQVVFANIQTMEKIYYQILQNPSDLGGIMQGLRKSNSAKKFVKLAKFQKVEDSNKEVESDQRFRDYWDKEEDYGPWGTMVDEKPEHSDKTYEEEKELHPNRVSKFKKI